MKTRIAVICKGCYGCIDPCGRTTVEDNNLGETKMMYNMENRSKLTSYSWHTPSGRVIKVLRSPEDKHIPPDVEECAANDISTDEYDFLITTWKPGSKL
jgi:hypothetical protein